MATIYFKSLVNVGQQQATTTYDPHTETKVISQTLREILETKRTFDRKDPMNQIP